MKSAAIIEEIKRLPAAEQIEVIQFTSELARKLQLTATESVELAGRLWKHCKRKIALVVPLIVTGLFLCGCTSVGHEKRALPKMAKPIGEIVEFGFDPDDNELSVAVEKLLDARGIRVKLLSTPQVRQQRGDKEYTYDEVQTRYVLRVRSVDLDTCVPEGSRQMHFNLSVTDFQKRQRVLLMKGEFGCRDTIVREFDKWLSSGRASGVNE